MGQSWPTCQMPKGVRENRGEANVVATSSREGWVFDKLWRGLEVVHLLVPPIPATLDEEEMNSVAATYTQEIEAIEVILSKANVILREFEDREKNVQQHVSTLQPAIFPSL